MSLTRREGTAKAISLYLTRLRFIRREIDGGTLLSMGYPTGPIFREIMQAVQDARVDGLVNTLEEEKAWVRQNFPVENTGMESGKKEVERADTKTKGFGDAEKWRGKTDKD